MRQSRAECRFAENTNLGQLLRRILAVLWTADWTSLDVRDRSKPVFAAPKSNFRFAPESGLKSEIAAFPGSANSRPQRLFRMAVT
jgi:hypothetical protein